MIVAVSAVIFNNYMYKALPEVVDGDLTSFTSESLHWPRISVKDEHLPMGKKAWKVQIFSFIFTWRGKRRLAISFCQNARETVVSVTKRALTLSKAYLLTVNFSI